MPSIPRSFQSNADQSAIERIRGQSDAVRSQYIIDIFCHFFGDGMKDNPTAFRGRFRKMAKSAFNFYRGSAVLFYQDLKVDNDKWIHENAADHIFIH
ncbi:unnamed protein product, partial [Didymodactylos carnosus]